MKRIAINGLGRIGRATLKIILDTPSLEIVALNDLVPTANLAYLLKFDSVYGRYSKTVESEENSLIIDGKKYPVYNEKDPSLLPWKKHNVEIVIESTGVFTNETGLKKHIKAGAKKVILSAPSKGGDVPTIVYGVNESKGEIVSCASCTTNCITPVVEVMSRYFGVKKAILNTIHSYTSSQAIVDSPSKKNRRGRAGALNLVPTSTGAAIATTKVMPEFSGKFDGVAIRTPTPVGSVADLVFVTEKSVSVDDINKVFREESETRRYKGVLRFSDEEIVSSDIIGDTHASIVDLTMTQVVDGDLVRVMSWYDNEWGYSNQLVRESLKA